MIRVLFLPLNYGDVRQDGVENAFTDLGCEVKVFDYMSKYVKMKNPRKIRESLITEAKEFRPHLIHMQIQHTSVIDAGTLKRIKQQIPNVIITNWTGDVRNYVPHTYKRVADVADHNLISSTGQMDLFKRALGKEVKYWQIGYNPKLYHPAKEQKELKYDAVFIGHHTKKEKYPGAPARIEACQLLTKEFGGKFAIFGNGWPKGIKTRGTVNQRQVASVYQESVCSISISHYNELDHYFSDRLLMCMASGRPTIALKFPNYESYFTNMCDLVIVNSVKEIPDAIRMLKNNPELANYIGASGAAKVFAEHTYYSRVKELLNMVGLV